jgi:hypothetical protein
VKLHFEGRFARFSDRTARDEVGGPGGGGFVPPGSGGFVPPARDDGPWSEGETF